MKGSEIVSGRVRLVCPQVKGNRKKSKLIASRWEIKLLLPFREWIIVWLCNRLKKKSMHSWIRWVHAPWSSSFK